MAELLQQPDGSSVKGKKKKRKGKKKKMTRSEKDLAKLEKATEKIKADVVGYMQFVDRMDKWLLLNADNLIKLFRAFDEDGECLLTYEEFKSGLFDLNAPCNKVESHLLAKLLDRENSGDIDYTEISTGLQYVREEMDLLRESEEADSHLVMTKRDIDHCKCCKMGIDEPYKVPYPKYILLELRFITFDSFKDHPGHIETLVHDHIPVQTLIRIIIEETSVQSTKLSIFTDKSRSPESRLPLDMTLKELGYVGDNYDKPEEITLYYDYKVEFMSCPILLCDYYFGKNSQAN
ncbi:hypothetical protein CHS0354_029816 [Potamilus streckersoni]|uniref:EF-hand domain-containing protein n=1 Tax=Potamilus streckersoni TaxID=2493646 RepID=A0AAE0THK5_9BIVA|nr:hypothetical protein CHS0354_029816 [Potamilus streckersoni]